MSFEFVDNNGAIDRAARRRIRSHVALGRNAGKTLARRSRKDASRGKPRPSEAFTPFQDEVQEAYAAESNAEVSWEVGRQVGDGLSVLFLPAQVDSKSKALVQRGTHAFQDLQTLYLHLITIRHVAISFLGGPKQSPDLSGALNNEQFVNSPASMWVQLIFVDEACTDHLVIRELDSDHFAH
jgi:hypothetical protein